MTSTTSPVLRASEATLRDLIGTADTILIDFRADWCAPCRTFAPVFTAAAERHPKVTFVEVDVDDDPAVAAAFRVRSIPTLVMIHDGKVRYAKPGGLSPKALDELIGRVTTAEA